MRISHIEPQGEVGGAQIFHQHGDGINARGQVISGPLGLVNDEINLPPWIDTAALGSEEQIGVAGPGRAAVGNIDRWRRGTEWPR